MKVLCASVRAILDFKGAREFLRDDSGQATLEYVLLLSITVAGAAALSRALLGSMDKALLRLGGELEKDLKTGRAGLDVWKN